MIQVITLDEFIKKMLHMLLNCINCEIIGQGRMRFENSFKPYSNNQ
jgi:hypothetical protein